MTAPGAARGPAPAGGETLPAPDAVDAIVVRDGRLDDTTAALVAAAAAVAGADEGRMREVLRAAHGAAPVAWIEEVLLQSYLFAGFPRALNAMRLWRAVSGEPAPAADADVHGDAELRRRGERTCARVYGRFYEPLRVNIAALHPALDRWMVTEGYGKVLGRPALDLVRRELCVVAACVAARQDRQLHSHLHGALHAGAAPAAVAAALEVALDTVADDRDRDAPRRYRQLWTKVAAKHAAADDS